MRLIFDIPERQQPATQQLRSGEEWIVELAYALEQAHGKRIIVPPSGLGTVAEMLRKPTWKTDYGSIPRPFRNILDKMKFGGAYILHDWLYKSKLLTRSQADAILRAVLKLQGANWLERNTIWSGVRMGGWVAWSNNGNGAALRKYYSEFINSPAASWLN